MEFSSQNAWLGGFQPVDDLSLENDWEWITSELWAYVNFADGEPNDTPFGDYIAGSEQYLEVYPGGEWNDAPGFEEKFFIVESENCWNYGSTL